MRIRLSDEDRERLGLEQEWLSISASRLSVTEADALWDAGYAYDDFLEELQGTPVLDGKGKPVMTPVLGDDGTPVLEDGKPKKVQQRRRRPRAWKAFVWLATRRVGCDVGFAEFDFDLNSLRLDDGDEPVGKDPSAATPTTSE